MDTNILFSQPNTGIRETFVFAHLNSSYFWDHYKTGQCNYFNPYTVHREKAQRYDLMADRIEKMCIF